jgi:hypothetical protein
MLENVKKIYVIALCNKYIDVIFNQFRGFGAFFRTGVSTIII